MQKIHLLHVVPTLNPGGMETALSRIANGLVRDGFSHSVVALKGDAVIRDRFDPSIRIHCLYAQARDPLVPLRLRRIIRQERPAVIHARNIWAWPEVALARLAVWPMSPLIFSFHGLSDTNPIPWRWRLTCRMLARATTEIFAVSHGSARFLVDHVGLPESRVGVIANGVDTERFSPIERISPRQELLVGTLGNLLPVKNQSLLVRACHRLIQEGIGLRLEIGGEGPERKALESLIDSLGIGNRVRLVGQVTDSPGFLRNLDVFVLPSASEAHPNALSEAMACGLPCVASRVGGVPEILNRGRAGVLFESGDLEGLVEALRSLLADEKARRSIGEIARAYTCGTYSMDLMLDRYRSLYLRLAGAVR